MNATTIATFSKPTIVAHVNSWAVSSTLAVPSLNASFNNYIVTSTLAKPTVSFIAYDSPIYSLTQELKQPIINAALYSSIAGVVQTVIKNPVIVFDLNIPKTYTTTYTLSKPVVVAAFDTLMLPVVQKTLPRPVFSITGTFTGTTTVQTWVMNTITGAHSRYNNYEFNSFFKLGTKHYGVSSTGIYEITGDLDNTSQISASIRLPNSSMGNMEMKSCSDAFIYGRTAGDMLLDVIVDEDKEFTEFPVYDDGRGGMHRKRGKIPKGIRGSSWQFVIRNDSGANFDINAFEIFIRKLQRTI